MSNRPIPEEQKAARIGRVLKSVVAQTTSGTDIDWDAIQREHADLMPELAESLKTLRDVQTAAKRARRKPVDGGTDETESAGDLCLAVLRRHLPQYADFKRVQAGGQGIVYRSRHRETGREVAIKVLGVAHSASTTAVQRIMREAELTARFNHPNIVTLFESGVAEGVPYCVLEFIHGLPIDLYVTLNDVEPREIAAMFVTVCRAISYAHQRGVIHRDLKPSNILVDSEGEPHVLDFGLAKDFGDHGSGLTQTMDFLGTLAYCSPEHLQPHLDAVDVSSDIYSLGVVLYQLLTGAAPYPTSGTYHETIRNILDRDPTPIVTRRRGHRARETDDVVIDNDLAAIVLKALAKEKSERYAWADAMADDLERYLRGDAVVARAGSRYYVFRKTLRRHRTAVTLGSVLLLTAMGTAIAFASMWKTTRAERDRARSAATLAVDVFDTVLGQVNNSVATLAGGNDVRDTLTETIVPKLDTLRNLAQEDAAMDRLWFASQQQLGDIALARGDEAQATDDFKRMLEVAEARLRSSPNDRDATLAAAQAYHKLGTASADSKDAFETSIRMLRGLIDRDPNDVEAERSLVEVYADYSSRRLRVGEYQSANDLAAAGVAFVQRHGRDAPSAELTDVLLRLFSIQAFSLGELGDPRAGEIIDEVLQRRSEIYERAPTNVVNRLALLRIYLVEGDRNSKLGARQRAAGDYELACLHGEYLTTADPTHPEYARGYDDGLLRLSNVLAETDRTDEARRRAATAQKLAERWLAREPNDSEWLRRRAQALRLCGVALVHAGDLSSAAAPLVEAANVLDGLAVREPGDALLQDYLGSLYELLAWLYARRGEHDSERQSLAKAFRVRETLADARRGDDRLRLDVVKSQLSLAQWHIRHGNRDRQSVAAKLLDDAEATLGATQATASTETERASSLREELQALRAKITPN